MTYLKAVLIEIEHLNRIIGQVRLSKRPSVKPIKKPMISNISYLSYKIFKYIRLI